MNEQRWSFPERYDKEWWGGGPWWEEPDMGNWCGYVGVAEGHPLFQIDYSGCPVNCGETWCHHSPESMLDVHGGITYSDLCREQDRPHGICHIPEPGAPDRVWWFGFDCAHSGDLVPGLYVGIPSFMPIPDIRGDTYRNLAYVRGECKRLAAQLRGKWG